MPVIDRELSSTEVVSLGFALSIKHLAIIVAPLFLGAILTAAARLLFAYQLAPLSAQLDSYNITAINSTNVGPFLATAGQVIGLTEFRDFVLWILAAPFFGLALKVAYDASTSTSTSPIGALSAWVRKLPALLVSSFIVGTLVIGLISAGALGSLRFSTLLVVLLIPAFMFAIMFLMFLPAVVLEGKSILGSLRRSRQLVSRRWRKAFIVGLVALILYFLIDFSFGALLVSLDVYQLAVAQSFYHLISDLFGVCFLTILYQSLLNKDRVGAQTSVDPAETSTHTE